MNHKYILVIIALFIYLSTGAQVSFVNRNDLLAERDLHSAVPAAIADMNGDGLNDIIAMDEGYILYVQYQTPDPERPYVRYNLPITVGTDFQNNIIIADFNNDGANDIFTVGSYDLVKVLYGVPYSYEFNLTSLFVTPFFSQGASSGDFNGDGWVDVVMLNDNGLNYTLINDGTGTLVEDEFFNFVTVPVSDNSGNYGSVYTDFDMDGDNDFYIAKCRQGVNSQTDPRRINVLFVNDGQNNYTQDAANYGLASGRQTWTTDFGDIDNDGDLDVFMTQHDVISELYENIDNDTFINITATSGLNIGGIPLQGMFRDFDNDGFLDILVSGDRVDFYHSNGDKTFTKISPFGNIVFGTYALGDLNNDGFTDVYASRVIPFNNPDLLREDILFLNETNDNHFLALTLKDTEGNSSAIGAMALIYGSWGTQIREVRGGEEYGVSNSHQMIFGLGQNTTYDSLIIRWPDGERESYNNLTVDESWKIERGGCYTKYVKLWDFIDVICGNDSIVLKVDNAVGNVQWSTGSVLDSIVVKNTGLYFATYRDENNCLITTTTLEAIMDPDTIKPVITYDGSTILCNKEIAVLTLPQASGYQWSTGETNRTILATQTGAYFAEVEGFCKSQQSDTIYLNFVVPEPPITESDSFFLGESATLVAHGDSIVWYYDAAGVSVIGTGEELVLNDLTSTVTVYAGNLNSIDGEDYQLGPVQQQGNPKYNAAFVNGGLLFDVYEPIILEKFTLHTDSAGTRIIEITDGAGFLYKQEISLDPGTTVMTLNVELPVGSYTLSTDTDQNNLEFGVNSPYLWRSSVGVLFPFSINNVVSITNSTYGEEFYYYFYDWKISTLDKYCVSDLVSVDAVLKFPVGINDPFLTESLIVFPNPTNGLTTISLKSALPASFEIVDMNGKVLHKGIVDTKENRTNLDLTEFSPGIYMIKMISEGQLMTSKVIKL
ncbi:MAG TPA: FG-GAP-like repeat-containing protein [Saprospiraceae bacterium]|nr:FG-GAP-like repeat-containing protein [Saprospiraceae bacterium]